MAQILKGAPVAAALNEKTKDTAAALAADGIIPTLAIIRVGEKPDDISYENGACRRAQAVGVNVVKLTLAADASETKLENIIHQVNNDPLIHGVLLLRPLPKQMNEARLVNLLSPAKDVDGITDSSLSGVFTGKKLGYAPCTAQACMEILDYYQMDCTGKNAVVIGRSLVIGRPVSMLLLHHNATVTICHTKTQNLVDQIRQADIVIAAAGQQQAFSPKYFRPGQIVLDVGIHFDADGKMCGDVITPAVSEVVDAITPVPGGVGAVTTAVLMNHVVTSAQNTR